MKNHPILEALEHIDASLITDAEQTPKKHRMPVPVWRTVAAIWTTLAVFFSLCAISTVQYIQDHAPADISYPISGNACISLWTPQKIIDNSDVVFEAMVLDISFYAEKASQGNRYDIYTVYTVAVSRTYKGFALPIEQIQICSGLKDYKLNEQLVALRKAGAPEDYNRIFISNDIMSVSTPQIGSTYLFCAHFVENQKFAPYPYFAFTDDPLLSTTNLYSASELKEHLPYVPHPMLVRFVVCGVALAILIPIRKKLKRKP